jgi:GNAT superfamily N-acetyltransferase
VQAAVIDFQPMGPQHLDGAHSLSSQAGWPHRLEDWQMLLHLSEGRVLVDVGRVLATIFLTPYGTDVATINMVIVDESLRGRGIGKALMQETLTLAGKRECRLVATADGLPLYRKLGFVETGEILQHQGPLALVPARPEGVDWADLADRDQILALDRDALCADRHRLIETLMAHGRMAVIRRNGVIVGYAAIRDFGRGKVVGPVIAQSHADADDLLSFLFSTCRAGQFLRVDTDVDSGIADWLTAHGLAHVGGGIAMTRPGKTSAGSLTSTASRFALASQALG